MCPPDQTTSRPPLHPAVGGGAQLVDFMLPRRPSLLRVLPVFLLAVLLPVTEEAQAQPGPIEELSLEDAFELARDFNPDFRIQESQLIGAEMSQRTAFGDLLPSASVSNSYGYQAPGERRSGSVVLGEQPDYWNSSFSANISYSLDGATLLRPGQARTESRATQAQVEGAERGLRAEVTDLYLSVLQADAELVQAREQLERVQLTLRQAEAQVEVGAATPLDIRRAEVQEGQAEVQVLQARNQTWATRLALARTLGIQLSEDVRLVTAFDLFEPELEVEALLDQAYETNPVLRASRLNAEVAEVSVRSARTSYYPSLSMSAGFSGSVFQAGNLDPLIDERLQQLSGQYSSCIEDNRLRDLLGDPPRDCSQFNPERPEVAQGAVDQVESNNRGWPFAYQTQPLSVSMSLSIPVFTGFSRQQQNEQARVSLSNAREQVRAEELRLRSEVTTAVRAVETARQTVTLQERIRETSTEELRLAQERFRLGLASSIEVADAQANLSQAERDEITAIYDFFQSFAALEALVGTTLDR